MSPVLAGWDPAKDRLLSGLTITNQGVKVGPCLINGKIGQGGMGAVYHAWHTMLNLEVAVKILPFHLVDDNQGYVQRFQREAQAAAVVSHQNLVRVFEMGCEKDIYFLILEFVNGESAHMRIGRKKQLDESEALRIVRDATLGLAAAHAKNIIHRDVKPDNILVGQDGTIKLADLGLAKIADADFAMTLSNVAMGTPQFMPPEQIVNSKAVTFASDIWAMGISLYYLLTAKYPFNADSLLGLLNIINEKTPDITVERPGISPATAAVIERCLQKEPAARYATAKELIAGLDAALTASVGTAGVAVDLSVPAESCLASKLGPYTPSLPIDAQAGAQFTPAPGSNAPTLLGQGATSSRGTGAGAAKDDSSYSSTLKLPPRGVITPPPAQVAGVGRVGGAAPAKAPTQPGVATSAVTALAPPIDPTLLTGATTVAVPSMRGRLIPILIALVITLPLTGYGLYWALRIKPYNDAVATGRAFEAKYDFADAAAAWKSAKELSPTPEATEHATRTTQLASLWDAAQSAQAAQDWKQAAQHCDEVLKIVPDFKAAKVLQVEALAEQERGKVLDDVAKGFTKLMKEDDWNFRGDVWDFTQKLNGDLKLYPHEPALQEDFVQISLRTNDLDELDRSLTYLTELLKQPGLSAADQTRLQSLQKRAQDAHTYAYTYAKVNEPMDKANEAAEKRLEAMVTNLEPASAGRAAALAILTAAEKAIPQEIADRADVIAKAHETFENNFVRLSQQLSQAAQRKGNFKLAIDALAPVVSKIDDYHHPAAIHALAMLKLMAQAQPLRAQPLGAFTGFTNEGNGKVVTPQNLPLPDLAEIRILRVIDADSVVAMAAGKFYFTSLKFDRWDKDTDETYGQDSVVLSPDLRLSTSFYDYIAQKGETPPADAHTLAVFEAAGDRQAYVRTDVTATKPDFSFNPQDTTLLMIGHTPGKTQDCLWALDVSKSMNSFDIYGEGWKILKNGGGLTLSDPQWLPDGSGFLYASFDAAQHHYTIEQVDLKTGRKNTLVTLGGADASKESIAAAAGPHMPALDPSGTVLALYLEAFHRISLIRLTDGQEITHLEATDVNPAQTGGGFNWSTDGKWLVYKALDGATPVFKVLGVQRGAPAQEEKKTP
ncbi:MAG: protein kinase domain-containing protein [Planctomycetota bacterium]